MYANPADKKAYFKQRYQDNKESYKNAMYKHWYKKAQEMFNIQEPTDDDCRKARNEYYKQYRKNNPKQTKEIQDRFYTNWGKKHNESEE